MLRSPDYAATLIVYLAAGNLGSAQRVAMVARTLPHIAILCVYENLDQRDRDILENNSNTELFKLEFALGKGAAFRAGLNRVRTSLVGFWDVEGIVRPADIAKSFSILESDSRIDGVVGSRFDDSVTSRAPFGRTLSSRALNLFGKMLFGIKVKDPQAPLKVFRKGVLKDLFIDMRLYDRGFDIELLFHASRRRLRLADLPIRWEAAPRNWPLLRIGFETIAALAFVRFLQSPVAFLPFVEVLGRKYCVPVKSHYRIMVFCWRDPMHPQSGGSETYLHEQAKRWVAAGHKVVWFAQSFEGSLHHQKVDGVEVFRAGRVPSVFLCGALWYTFRSGRNFDFIIDCMNGIPFFTPLFSTKPKVCLVHHIHARHFAEELPPVIGRLAAFVEARVVPFVYRATSFLTVSPSTGAEMQKMRMSRFPIEIIHNGVDAALVPGRKAAKPTVLYLGRLKRYKRVHILIEEFSAVRAAVPDAELIIAGTGDYERELRALVDEKRIAGVTFAGFVDDDEKLRLLQSAWVFAMPSSVEGWGIAVIEANACGTPAVAFDVKGLRDCIRHDYSGLLVTDRAAFRSAIIRLLLNEPLRNQLASSARVWSAQFSWEQTAARTLETIRCMHPWRAVFEPMGETGEIRYIPSLVTRERELTR